MGETSRQERILGILGGTGPEGRGLAARFALAFERVLIGSRELARADAAAERISRLVPGASVRGASNRDVARDADLAIVAVPYAGHADTLASLRHELAGKIVVDVVSPLALSGGVARALKVAEGSVALQAHALLAESVVASAFHTVSAGDLADIDRPIDADVVVCSNDSIAKSTVMRLAEDIQGIRAVDGGGLENSRYLEDFSALLLNINRIYNAHSMLKIAGI